MNDEILGFFAMIGVFFFGVMLFFLVGDALCHIKDAIGCYLYDYKRTHLKGKRVKAACYCEYCKHFEKHEPYNKCKYSTTPVDSMCFCWRAYPISEDAYKVREEYLNKENE